MLEGTHLPSRFIAYRYKNMNTIDTPNIIFLVWVRICLSKLGLQRFSICCQCIHICNLTTKLHPKTSSLNCRLCHRHPSNLHWQCRMQNSILGGQMKDNGGTIFKNGIKINKSPYFVKCTHKLAQFLLQNFHSTYPKISTHFLKKNFCEFLQIKMLRIFVKRHALGLQHLHNFVVLFMNLVLSQLPISFTA